MNRQAVQTLKTYFGYDTFREGQESVVESILEHRDVLAIMPSRKIHLLSGTGTDAVRNYDCNFSSDLTDAGSGKGFE